MKTSRRFREVLSEKLMDLGNFSIAGLVFGQFVSGREFSNPILLLGIIFAIACYIISYLVNS